MAFQKGFIEVTLEVEPAPGCFLTANPMAVRVPKGDLAIFHVTVQRLNGFDGPVYLSAVNLAGGHSWSQNPIPAGQNTADLTVETEGWQPGPPFPVGVEANDVPYPD